MDLKVKKGLNENRNYLESYANDELAKYLEKYSFINNIRVFFRGKKHPSKKVKLQARFKGKDVFVEATGKNYGEAFDNALIKLKAHIDKYKTHRYRRAS